MHTLPSQGIDHVRGRILPHIQRPGAGPGIELVPGQISVGLILDGPAGSRVVGYRDMSDWRSSPETLVPMAVENLRLRSSQEGWYPLRAVPGMQVYLAGDGHAASRLLLLRELIDPWPLGGVLVAVPTPDQLLAVPLDTLENLALVQVLVQSGQLAHSLGHEPVSDQVFWHDGAQYAHVQVTHGEDTVEVMPPPGFLRMIEKLASLQLSTQPGEA